MYDIAIGIDNGTSGSIGIICPSKKLVEYTKVPTKQTISYTKDAKFISRIDTEVLYAYLHAHIGQMTAKVLLERPMINPFLSFSVSMLASRAHEATLIVLERLGVSFEHLDSKEWQSKLLPSVKKSKEDKEKEKKGKESKKKQTKILSLEVGKRTFPSIDFSNFDDADGLLIAEYCRLKHLNS